MAITLLDAQPPAVLADGRVLVPPNRDELLVEFELAGEADERVRVEVFHPEAIEDVTPKVVEGFFDVARSRGRTKISVPPGARDAAVSVSSPQTTPARCACAPSREAMTSLSSFCPSRWRCSRSTA